MITGIELISEERKEQIEKHGYTVEEDTSRYDEDVTWNYAEPSDLVTAAVASIYARKSDFPHSWKATHSPFMDKIIAKTYRERLVIAGALIAAELDRHLAKWGE